MMPTVQTRRPGKLRHRWPRSLWGGIRPENAGKLQPLVITPANSRSHDVRHAKLYVKCGSSWSYVSRMCCDITLVSPTTGMKLVSPAQRGTR